MNNLQTSNPSETKNEIVVYQPDETVRLDVRLEENTVWLTQNQMTDLFQRDRSVITRHINNVFTEGELDEQSNVHFLHIAISDKPVKMYSLNVIISVGYRVKSLRGIQFRIWATNVLREYLLRGYSVNARLNQLEDRMDRRLAKTEADVIELKEKVDFFVQTKEPPLQGVFYDGQLWDAPGARRGSSLKPSPAAPRQPMRSACSSGQRPNRQLVATRRHGTATINSIRRLSLTLTGSPRFMKCAAATSGHQFPLVRFPASRATLEFTTKFIVMSAGCPCTTAAPHTLRYIHGFARAGIARERRRFVGGAFATRAMTGTCRSRQERPSRLITERAIAIVARTNYGSLPLNARHIAGATTITIDRNICVLCDTDPYGRSPRQLSVQDISPRP
jgi:hypothetical protein